MLQQKILPLGLSPEQLICGIAAIASQSEAKNSPFFLHLDALPL
jgi:hypothetical protein